MGSSKTALAVMKRVSSQPKDGKPSSTTKPSGNSTTITRGTSKSTTQSEARIAAKVLASPTSSKMQKSKATSLLSSKTDPFPVLSYRVPGSSLTQKRSAAIIQKVIKKSK